MPRAKKDKNYFTQATEDAIIRYNGSSDFEERSKIYREELHVPFHKLTENIIHTFKYYHTEEENLEDLQHEVVTFLLTKLHLFDPTKGAKAYSYFGTVAKRYLIASNQKTYKKKLEVLPLEALNIEEDGEVMYAEVADDAELHDTSTVGHAVDDLSNFLDLYISFCSKYLYQLFPKEEEAKIADAILELFRKRENISIFNKKALYIYVRELVDVKTPKITKVANALAEVYQEYYYQYLEDGHTDFEI